MSRREAIAACVVCTTVLTFPSVKRSVVVVSRHVAVVRGVQLSDLHGCARGERIGGWAGVLLGSGGRRHGDLDTGTHQSGEDSLYHHCRCETSIQAHSQVVRTC